MSWNVGMNYDMVGIQVDDFKSSDKKVHVTYIYSLRIFSLKWLVNAQGPLQNANCYQFIIS